MCLALEAVSIVIVSSGTNTKSVLSMTSRSSSSSDLTPLSAGRHLLYVAYKKNCSPFNMFTVCLDSGRERTLRLGGGT